MNDSSKAGYDIAIKLTDKLSRTVWSVYTGLLATNAFLVSLAAFLSTQHNVQSIAVKVVGALGLFICAAWYLINQRSFDYYGYYFAWARKLEKDAFGNDVEMIRNGQVFARGDTTRIGDSEMRLRWGSRLFKALLNFEWVKRHAG
jgi:hypothetical protein